MNREIFNLDKKEFEILKFDKKNLPSLQVEPVSIKIVSVPGVPTDWTALIITVIAIIVGAFIGSFVAFLFNWAYEYKKERDKYNAIINQTVQTLSMNALRMVNFKAQFLIKFNAEFAQIKDYTNRAESTDKKFVEWKKDILPLICKICVEDGELSGLLKKWDELEFTQIELKSLYFVVFGVADIIRILEQANEQIKSFNRIIQARNTEWDAANWGHFPWVINGRILPDHTSLMLLFTFIDHRDNLRKTVDFYIALSTRAIRQLNFYRRVHFPKEGKLRRVYRFIRYNFQDRRWSKVIFPQEAKKLFPAKDEYKDFIDPNPEMIKIARKKQREKNRKRKNTFCIK